MRLSRSLRAAVTAAATALVVSGCGNLAPTQSAAPEPLPPSGPLSLANFAVVVLAATDDAGSVHAERVETTHGLRTEMTGDTRFDRAAYQGRITLRTAPAGTGKAAWTNRGELRLVDGRAYLHVSGVVPKGKFVAMDLEGETSEVGGICACLFSQLEPTTTLRNMRLSLTGVDFLGREKKAGVSLEHYRLKANTEMIPGAVDAAHPATTRTYDVWLDARHLMRRLAYSTVDKTVAVTYTDWGRRVHVQRPGARQILLMPGLGATRA